MLRKYFEISCKLQIFVVQKKRKGEVLNFPFFYVYNF